MHGKSCPIDLTKVPPWKRYLRLFLRIIILINAVYQIILGEMFFGILALLALAALLTPWFFTKNRICVVPVDIEILFLIVIFFELIMADAYSFYSRVPYYDKFMHLLISSIVGLVGMMIIYTFYALGKLQASTGVMFTLIVLITMGMGAGLEMAEYFYDQALYPVIGHYLPTGLTQGSMVASPLADTMEDLFIDTLGGILGAAVGIIIIKREEKKGTEPEMLDELEALASGNNEHE
ncbi:hypothetical protein [Methanobacterium petrolearium]|uniref:hypothetical protein n=1 Tax=Methanobacterium petrolearium TaxID=710190 RepID=UPI001AEB73AB|nr:hypothetical protein [Methanobacterium petrolearium]MBP1944921.1 hypothetical protein [Methanobacterium petrolearium]